MDNIEIERKFLLSVSIENLPIDTATDMIEITQGYLCIDKNSKDEVRLRMSIPGNGSDPLYTITAKKGTGLVRGEYEVYIDIWQFGMLWKAVDK
jgi:CYTH domain-containing protein